MTTRDYYVQVHHAVSDAVLQFGIEEGASVDEVGHKVVQWMHTNAGYSVEELRLVCVIDCSCEHTRRFVPPHWRKIVSRLPPPA